jgi:hypothetical protein
LGIQSKLLAMLLAFTVLSTLVAGFFGYRSGSHGLTAAAYEQLTSVRDARTREVNSLYAVLRRSALLNGLNATGTESMTAFTRAFKELQTETVTPADQAALDRYYEKVFIPELAKNVEGEVDAASFMPSSAAQRYLQAQYTAAPADADAAIQVTTQATEATGRRRTPSTTSSSTPWSARPAWRTRCWSTPREMWSTPRTRASTWGRTC